MHRLSQDDPIVVRNPLSRWAIAREWTSGLEGAMARIHGDARTWSSGGRRGGLLDDLAAFDADFDAACVRQGPRADREADLRARALYGRPNDLALLPGRRQAFRVVRRRTVTRMGKTAAETVHRLTSLGPDCAGPAEIPALNRGRWEIGNRLHCVRDFPCDEDRSRMRSGAAARPPPASAFPPSPCREGSALPPQHWAPTARVSVSPNRPAQPHRYALGGWVRALAGTGDRPNL